MKLSRLLYSLIVILMLPLGACSKDEPTGNNPGGGDNIDQPQQSVSDLVGIWQCGNKYWQFNSDGSGYEYDYDPDSSGYHSQDPFTYIVMGQQVVITFGTGMDTETMLFQYTVSNGMLVVIHNNGETEVFTKVNQLPGNNDGPSQTSSLLIGIWKRSERAEYWQFNADGKGYLYDYEPSSSGYGEINPFTYIDMGQQVVITLNEGTVDVFTEAFNYSVSNGLLVITSEKGPQVFIKVDSLPAYPDNPTDLNTELQRARRLIIGMWTAVFEMNYSQYIMAIQFLDNGIAVMAGKDLYSNEDPEVCEYSYSVEIRQGKINLGMKVLGEETLQWQYVNISFPDDNTMVLSGVDEYDGIIHTYNFNRYIED